jgi:transposase, IS5 family
VRVGGTELRDRSRSVKLRLLEIARVARSKGPLNRDKLKVLYCRLLASTSRVVGQAKPFSNDIAHGLKQSRDLVQQIALEGLRRDLGATVPLVRQVMRQTRARILHGETRSEGKILSASPLPLPGGWRCSGFADWLERARSGIRIRADSAANSCLRGGGRHAK